MKRLYPVLLSLGSLLTAASLQAAETLLSPDGTIKVQLSLQDGRPMYEVFCRDTVFLEPSPLGFESSLGSFSEQLEWVASESTSIEETYALPHGKVSEVHYRANELVVRYRNPTGDEMELQFRVSDRDVAFRYRLPGDTHRRMVIEREATGFDFCEGTTAFVTQQVAGGEGWKATKPSYEEAYQMDVPVGTASPSGRGFTFPALFRIGTHGWVLLSETGVSSKYAGCRLADPTPAGLYCVAFPGQDENAGIGDATVTLSLPAQTAWRTITLGDTLASIVETTVATDVVEPLYDAVCPYLPGKATWSWLLWQDGSMNWNDQVTFIDLASEMGYAYILIDALWDQNIGRDGMEKLVDYAHSKSVDVLLWYNSNGSWNDAPQSPRNCLDTAPARQAEMAWLQSIGVKGLKVDFFGGDKQITMMLYEDLLTDANQYGLSLNFHGTTLPRGWERMYPNHMTSEAVTASENLVFSQGFADKEAFNSTVFPFVRNPVAAMDYGPMVLNPRFSKDATHGNLRRTTDAFQLATTVLYQSPIQHFGLVPGNLDTQPVYVIEFLKTVPTVWDEVRYIDGYPGQFVVLARRSGSDWYIAATHAGTEARELSISLHCLKNKTVECFVDQPDCSVGLHAAEFDSSGELTLKLEPMGGAVLICRGQP